MNQLGKEKRPFLFVLDFELKEPIVIPLNEISNQAICYHINGKSNDLPASQSSLPLWFEKHPISFEQYQKAFNKVQNALHLGDSYLCNLTFPTELRFNWTLQEIYHQSQAKYKLWIKDKLVVFSPEIFVKIQNGQISSHPMKGTIDANLPDARKHLLHNFKEIAEHNTIVDLIRNDINRVATKTQVKQFRYIDLIQTNGKDLFQMSSQIVGQLPHNYHENLGTIFQQLLPAGSITGAPKKKTVEIIKDAEDFERGFYTGIFGIFDGQNVDSGVLIRCIEKIEDKYYFKSGGGITVHSNAFSEYQELIDKVYVPITRKHPNRKSASPQSSLSSKQSKSVTKI